MSKTTTLHVHHVHYISLPSLHDNDVKFPQVAFYGEPKHKTKTFSFSLKTWVQPLRLHFGKVQLYLRFYATRNNREKVWKNEAFLMSDVFTALAVVVAKAPYFIHSTLSS